jgi:hypothetical protein
MKKRFRKDAFVDSAGKAVTDYLIDLLKSDIDVVRLATFAQRISNEDVLFGECVDAWRPPRPRVQLWVYQAGAYGLLYSYREDRNEVLFLELFQGEPSEHIHEGWRRFKQFYGLP